MLSLLRYVYVTSLLLSLLWAVRPVSSIAAEDWESTVERVSRAVVALRVRGTRDFDTERARGSTGTGFVIDREAGLILTNRHMVHTGPVVAEAVFLNHEEVELEAVYRDPVHDFGFYRFDPEKVRFMQLEELELRPDLARVGMEIRIIGNDSGEKISILGSTLARLDREAPDYGSNTYNDFNTFYLQAASNTSGGSSGSPVVDREGHVIGLNAGSRVNTASAFYLPLDRVVRAVPYVLRGEVPPRGTLQATLSYTPYDELRRLGLSEAAEAAARDRFPDNVGLLVVDRLVPAGPAYRGGLRPGDIVIELGGNAVGSFVDVAQVLDASVGETLQASIERGGQALTVELEVGDLHTITPNTFLEFGRAVLHPLSYTQARNHNLQVEGVYVAQAGYSLQRGGVSASSVILSIDGHPTPDLDALQGKLESLPDQHRARVRYHPVNDPRQPREAVIPIDRTWHAMRRCRRGPIGGEWGCVESPPPPPPPPPETSVVRFAPGSSRAGRALAHSVALVQFNIPYPTAGIVNTRYRGFGLVVDADQGLILTDRDTVPVLLGDLRVSFAGQASIPASVRYLHPVHNLAVIQYDPALLGDTPVRSARFVDRDVHPGDRVWQIALDSGGGLVDYETRVAQVGTFAIGSGGSPRFRDVNVEGFSLTDSLSSVGGVIADRRGRVIAGWLSFFDPGTDRAGLRALPSPFLQRIIEPLRAGEPVDYRALGFEMRALQIAAGRERGLSQDRIDAILDLTERDRRVLEVTRVWGGAPAQDLVQNGDILISINDEPVTRMLQVERHTRQEQVDLLVLRDGEEIPLRVPTLALDGSPTDRVVQWAGLIVHDPHLEVANQSGKVRDGVYGAWVWYGTPAFDARVRPTRRIVEIDGEPVSSLEEFIQIVSLQQDRQPTRVLLEWLDGRVEARTLKLDLQFWPTIELRYDGERWSRTLLSPSDPLEPPP
ncbi:MAG: PDZ domain-containing protein [Deltaproteobacteria bacterium]|nr:MAG: PDZ domain-containing protein [Deltaproteobacteria bacterium]